MSKKYPANALLWSTLPKSGWALSHEEYREGSLTQCQWCCVQWLHTVYILTHPACPKAIEVGCVCVVALTNLPKLAVVQRGRRVTEKVKRFHNAWRFQEGVGYGNYGKWINKVSGDEIIKSKSGSWMLKGVGFGTPDAAKATLKMVR